MFETFLQKFTITSQSLKVREDIDFFTALPAELFGMLEAYAGTSFNNGLYRVHSFQSGVKWSSIIADYFNQYRNRIYPFAFDWMGRQFCLDAADLILYMFDPATGEDFEFKQTIVLLHEDDFVNSTNEILSNDLFQQVLIFNQKNSLAYNECFGHKIPLFLGGKDQVENYEVQNMEVYWSILSQLYHQTKDLPDGTKIKNITFEK